MITVEVFRDGAFEDISEYILNADDITYERECNFFEQIFKSAQLSFKVKQNATIDNIVNWIAGINEDILFRINYSELGMVNQNFYLPHKEKYNFFSRNLKEKYIAFDLVDYAYILKDIDLSFKFFDDEKGTKMKVIPEDNSLISNKGNEGIFSTGLSNHGTNVIDSGNMSGDYMTYDFSKKYTNLTDFLIANDDFTEVRYKAGETIMFDDQDEKYMCVVDWGTPYESSREYEHFTPLGRSWESSDRWDNYKGYGLNTERFCCTNIFSSHLSSVMSTIDGRLPENAPVSMASLKTTIEFNAPPIETFIRIPELESSNDVIIIDFVTFNYLYTLGESVLDVDLPFSSFNIDHFNREDSYASTGNTMPVSYKLSATLAHEVEHLNYPKQSCLFCNFALLHDRTNDTIMLYAINKLQVKKLKTWSVAKTLPSEWDNLYVHPAKFAFNYAMNDEDAGVSSVADCLTVMVHNSKIPYLNREPIWFETERPSAEELGLGNHFFYVLSTGRLLTVNVQVEGQNYVETLTRSIASNNPRFYFAYECYDYYAITPDIGNYEPSDSIQQTFKIQDAFILRTYDAYDEEIPRPILIFNRQVAGGSNATQLGRTVLNRRYESDSTNITQRWFRTVNPQTRLDFGFNHCLDCDQYIATHSGIFIEGSFSFYPIDYPPIAPGQYRINNEKNVLSYYGDPFLNHLFFYGFSDMKFWDLMKDIMVKTGITMKYKTIGGVLRFTPNEFDATLGTYTISQSDVLEWNTRGLGNIDFNYKQDEAETLSKGLNDYYNFVIGTAIIHNIEIKNKDASIELFHELIIDSESYGIIVKTEISADIIKIKTIKLDS